MNCFDSCVGKLHTQGNHSTTKICPDDNTMNLTSVRGGVLPSQLNNHRRQVHSLSFFFNRWLAIGSVDLDSSILGVAIGGL